VPKWKLERLAERTQLAWRDPVGKVRFAGPPAMRQAAVRTLRLDTVSGSFLNVNAGGKFLTRGRALRHQHAHGYLQCLAGIRN
jgi:hypothetical protein